MMKSITKYLCLVLFLAGCLQFATSQSIHAQSDNKAFRYFTPQDGFPTFVYRMAQGPKGQIWMSGPSGLSKFDGYNVHTFTHDPNDPFSIPGGVIYYVMTDKKGYVWLTGPAGVTYYDSELERFTLVPIPDSLPATGNSIGDLLQTADEYIWTTNTEGMYRFTPPTEAQPVPEVTFFSIGLDDTERIFFFKAIEGPNELIWLPSNQGIYHFNRETETFTKAGLFNDIAPDFDKSTFYAMARDPDNTIWVGYEGGIVVFKEGAQKPELITTLGVDNFDLSDVEISSMKFARDGALWIGTMSDGALHFDPSTNELTQYTNETNNAESISENSILDILEDMDGNVWFGHTTNGMSMMYEKTWSYTYQQITDTEDPNHSSNNALDLVEDQDSNLWAATQYGLAYIPGDGSPQIYLPDPEIPASNYDENGLPDIDLHKDLIFVVEWNEELNTLYTFNIKEELFTPVQIPDSLANFGRFEATETTIYWTARGSSQLVALDKDDLNIRTFDLPLDFPKNENDADTFVAARPIISTSGEVYIHFSYGSQNNFFSSNWMYYKFDSEREDFSLITMPPIEGVRISPSAVIASKINDKIVWSLTDQGLLKEDLSNGSRKLTPIALTSNELSFGTLLEDNNGSVWFSNLGGTIRKIDPSSERVNSYPLDLGRQPTFIGTAAQLSNGDILFGGSGGYIQFDPSEVRDEADIQRLYITEFQSGTERITVPGAERDYEIDYENNNVSFSYLGINYRSPNNRYRYRILGYDDDWVDMGTQRSIFFANLPFGNYNFQVQASAPGSSFSDKSAQTEVHFAILPPWWRTTSAYLMYFLLFGGFVFGIDRIQRKRVIQKERERATKKELKQAREIEKAYKNLEVAHKDLEQAHSNLKSAQDQLVQQEKLASLGQLTAGIAHEIKNPLNFVNNFSDLSVELVEEAREELSALSRQLSGNSPLEEGAGANAKAGDVSHVDEVLTTLNDIETNLRKIYEHGSRADSIVKSMLEHSRGGSGKMEPTDLNALVKEFVNLTFHGMRASKNPINVDMEFDLDESIREVPLIAEDFSRVIINLCNNAFDAMRDVETQNPASLPQGGKSEYKPKLTVRTKKENGNVVIEIEDNGPGIPEEMKDKILQPFFTTKKGTEGTGLGLSITNDIVKAHGGSMKVHSQPGETVFTINLSG